VTSTFFRQVSGLFTFSQSNVGPQLFHALQGYFDHYSDEDLKNLSKKDLEATVKSLQQIIFETSGPSITEEIEAMKLGVCLRWLKSSFLEKRITGILEIKVSTSFPVHWCRKKIIMKMVPPC